MEVLAQSAAVDKARRARQAKIDELTKRLGDGGDAEPEASSDDDSDDDDDADDDAD